MSGFAPEIGPDGRPRPKFGEYATPEEQRARIRQPDATEALSAGEAPTPRTEAVRGGQGASGPAPVASTAGASATGRSASARPVDRIITVGLLVYGLFTVITSIPSAADYSGFASMFLSTLGIDVELTDPQAGRGWGLAAALVLGIGWLLAATLSWFSLRAGRLSFWIPLAAGLVCNLTASILLVAPLMADPAVWSALQSTLVGDPS